MMLCQVELVLRLFTRETTITMEIPIAIVILKGPCLSQVVQLGEFGLYYNTYFITLNYNLSTKLTTISETIPAMATLSPPSFTIVEIVPSHTYPLEALTATSADSLEHTILHTSYKNAINLACAVYLTKNLTNQFAALATEAEDIMLQYDTTITNYTLLTTHIIRLKAQLMLTLTLITTTTNLSPHSCKGQTNPRHSLGRTMAS
jgi:hypothetical protein